MKTMNLLFLSFMLLFLSCETNSDTPNDLPKECSSCTYNEICLNGTCVLFEPTQDEIINYIQRANACKTMYIPDPNQFLSNTEFLLNLDQHSLEFQANKEQYSHQVKRLKEKMQCSKQANDCSALYQCLGVIETESCDSENFYPSCKGNHIISCTDENKTIEIPCKMDEFCLSLPFFPQCVNQYHVQYCRSSFFTSYCKDSQHIVSCSETGKVITQTCGENSVCVLNDKNEGYCKAIEEAPECEYTKSTATGCDGSKIEICMFNKVIKKDCKEIAGDNYVCNPSLADEYLSNDIAKHCILKKAVNACNQENSCKNDTLHYCFYGEEKTFNCIENGYKSCKTENQKFSELTYSYCSY